MTDPRYDIIIVGGGPSGLACGIEARKAGLRYLILEKGGIADSIRRFPLNMTFFSTPELLELGKIPFSCTNVRPNRIEALEYYRRVVSYFDLDIHTHVRVRAIDKNAASFRISTCGGAIYESNHVIIATGYFDHTNKLNVPGEDLANVSHYYDEPYAYAMTNVVVVGGRNSSVETALDLYRHGAKVTIVHRGRELGSVKYWIRPDIENRTKEGSIRCHLNSIVHQISEHAVVIDNLGNGKTSTLKADFVFAMIGYRPDEALLKSAGIKLNEKNLIPEYDQRTFETNITDLYIAGSVACGCETWNIFIENGRAHADPIIKHIVSKRSG